MARIWCSTPPGFGHFGPTAPLASAMLDAGHDVRVVTSPPFVSVVERAGLPAIGLGRPWVEERVEDTFPECCVDGIPRMSLVFEAAATEMLEAMLEEAARSRPDLITWVWPVEYAGAVAASALGVPGIAIATSAVVPLDLYALIRGGPLGRLRDGVALEDDPGQGWLADMPHLTFFPASLDPTEDHQVPIERVRYEALDTTGGEMPPQVAALLELDEPLILATLGTVYNRRGLLPVLLDAVAGQPYQVIVATGSTVSPEDLPEPASNVTVVPWVPFAQLIGRCDLVVHHGGTNTTLLAAREGVPSVVVPLGADQFTNAEITGRAGVSYVVLEPGRTAPAIRQAIGHVLADEQYQQRASAVAIEINGMPKGPAVVRRLVNQLLSAGA